MYQWLPLYDVAVYGALGLGLLVLLLIARRTARSPAARSWVLLVLRVLVLGLLIGLLVNPVAVTESILPPQRPDYVFLVDCSKSMILDKPVHRLDRVREVLLETEHLITSRQPPRVSRYRFGQKLAAASPAETLCATDDATRLREALQRLPRRFTRGWPSGIVVFSDGRSTEKGGFEDVAAEYWHHGVPIHVFPVGDPNVTGDVAIEELIGPRDAPDGTRVPLRIQTRCTGYEGRRAVIHIRPDTGNPRKPITSIPFTLSEGVQTHDLFIDHKRSQTDLVAEVRHLDGEAIEENNRVAFRIATRDEKLRVIYMEGTVGCHQRIPEALAEDEKIACLTMTLDDQRITRPTIQRIEDRSRGYPITREELFSYDVILCGDIPRVSFTQEQLAWTVELVRDRGGGFAMIGGHTAFNSGRWDQTIWDGLIPVDITERFGRRYTYTRFKLRIPYLVDRHPIWRIVEDPAENRRILSRIPIFTGTNLIERAKPAATVLAYSDRPIKEVNAMPIFSCQTYGKGRTLAITTDTTVDWGIYFEKIWGEGDNRYFRKFIRNVVYWLGENSLRGKRRLAVETDKIVYRSGEPITITARVFDENREQTDRYRLVARLCNRRPGAGGSTDVVQRTTLFPEGNDPVFRGKLTAASRRSLAPSVATAASSVSRLALDVVAYDGSKTVAKATLAIQVVEDTVEYRDPRPDPERLTALATATGGTELRSAEELAQLLTSCRPTPGKAVIRTAPIWDRPELWGLMLALLAIEWAIRRRRGLA